MENYIYVGSYERRWVTVPWSQKRSHKGGEQKCFEIGTCLVMVNYCMTLDGILEEQIMFDEENDEGLTINREFVITDFDKQVCEPYTNFIVNNIKLLRHGT